MLSSLSLSPSDEETAPDTYPESRQTSDASHGIFLIACVLSHFLLCDLFFFRPLNYEILLLN